jgi:hypothetical protein
MRVHNSYEDHVLVITLAEKFSSLLRFIAKKMPFHIHAPPRHILFFLPPSSLQYIQLVFCFFIRHFSILKFTAFQIIHIIHSMNTLGQFHSVHFNLT